MADLWLPGAYRDPGVNAGYNAGRSAMMRAVAHFTVGSDSRQIGRNGYFHWLVHRDASRENGCTQYAPIDAVTWHAANEGNPFGPGCEWERNVIGPPGPDGISEAEPPTANQIEWGKRIVAFCAEWGIPADLYDGPRYGAGNWSGWVNHHDLSSERSDGLTRAEWNLMTAHAAPVPTPKEEDMAKLITSDPAQGSDTILYTGMGWRQVVPGEDQQLFDLGFVPSKSPVVIDPATMTRIRTTLPEVKA